MAFEARPAPDRKLGQDFEEVTQEALQKLFDDLEDKKITRGKFDASAAVLNRALAAKDMDEALEILRDATVEDLISGATYRTIKAALTATPESTRKINLDTERMAADVIRAKLKSLVGEGSTEGGPEQAEVVASEIVDELASSPDSLRAVVEGVNPDLPLNERNEIVEDIESKGGRRKLVETVAGYLKHLKSWEFVAGFGAGAGARTAIRLAFGGSLGVGIAAGAIGGAVTGGVREYVKERGGIRRKFVAGSVLWQLGEGMEGKSDAGRAAIVARADQAYRRGRVSGNKEEMEILAEELRAAKLLVDSNIEWLGDEGDEVKKIKAILVTASGLKRLVPKTERKEVQKLIDEVIFARNKVDLRKVAGSALRGAAVGAVGGAIGGAVANYFSEHLHLVGHGASVGRSAAPAHGMPAQAVPGAPAATKAISQEFLMKKSEAANAAIKKTLEKAQTEIMDQKFGAVVEKGDGATHIARKIAHDYLVNQRWLNHDSFTNLTPEQMVYVEDTLQKSISKTAEKGFNIGDHLELSGEDVAKAIEKATKLSPEKLGHLGELLLKEPGHHLSSKTLETMSNLDDVGDPGNHFYGSVIKEAQEVAAKAMSQVQEVIPAPQIPVAEAAQKGGKEVAKTVAESSASKILKLVALYGGAKGIGGFGAGVAVGFGGLGLTRAALRRAEKAGEVVSDQELKERTHQFLAAIPEVTEPPRGLPFVEDDTPPAVSPLERTEKPKSTQELFNELTGSYARDKKIRISVTDDNEMGAVVRTFPAIKKMIEEIGEKRLRGAAINFFKPAYGASAKMFVGGVVKNKKRKIVADRAINININATVEDMKKFIEDNLK